jgi:DNA-binding transcriptional LysR family regulator
MLKIQSLRQLVAAAESGSFKAAAAETFRTQAAVSLAMRELERTFGAPLVERDRRGKLTPYARTLVPLLRELLARHDVVLTQARELAAGRQGLLRLAVPPFLAEQWLPDVIGRFAASNPDVRIESLEERSSRISALVGGGIADIGVAGLIADDAMLRVHAIARDAYGVLCAVDHGFARRLQVPWNALRGERLIGSDALAALAAVGVAPALPPPALTVTSRAPLFACVRRHLGVTILPMLSRPRRLDRLAFVPLVRPSLSRTLAIVTRRDESLLPAGERLLALLTASLIGFARERGARLLVS